MQIQISITKYTYVIIPPPDKQYQLYFNLHDGWLGDIFYY